MKLINYYNNVYKYIYEKFTNGDAEKRHSWAVALISGVQILYLIDIFYFCLKFTDYGVQNNFIANIKLKLYVITFLFVLVNTYLSNEAKKLSKESSDYVKSTRDSNVIAIILVLPAIIFLIIFMW